MNEPQALAEWFDKTGAKQVHVAREIGTSESHLSLILSGDRRPSPKLAAKLEKLTGIDARRLLGIANEARQ